MDNITLQINLSPGDINYAELTVPALASKHADIKKRLLVVDCCRPQKTKFVNPDVMFPEEKFKQRVERIIGISQKLLNEGHMTDVYYLKPGDPLFRKLSKKYLRGVYSETHASGGTANMGYWAAIELPDTRYVLHYDGDMMLHQDKQFLWTDEAMKYLKQNEHAVIATPRTCPPVADETFDLPSVHEGRPIESFNDYWINDWFSTRCFLMDRERLAKFLPLIRSGLLVETLLRKYGRKAFPVDPEAILFRSIAPRGGRHIILKSKAAWLMHPASKPPEYLSILPAIIDSINTGNVPEEQKGHEDIKLESWLNFLKQPAT